MAGYKQRIADKLLERKLKGKGAVLIEGPKWCGKTTTAEQVAKSVLYMSDPEDMKANLAVADISPRKLLAGETPRLIDEWQIAPKLWDAIRFEVDHRENYGHFILTGSAVPPRTDEIFHSGTGRFAWLKMRPMSLYESCESTGGISLKALFSGLDSVIAENTLTLDDIAFLICRGGWPGTLGMEKDIALDQANDYYDAVVNSDISRVDGVSRDAERTKRLMRSYARNQGSQATNTVIKEDMRVYRKAVPLKDTFFC